MNYFSDRKDCIPITEFPFCVDPDFGNVTAFINQGRVKKALDKPDSFVFLNLDLDIQNAFRDDGSFSNPTTRELIDVLEAYDKEDSVADIKVLVINGNDDYIVNTAGNKWQYDRLEWIGQAEYSIKNWRPLPEGLAATGSWKGTSDGRLVFVAVDGAGHTVPGDVREGSFRILQKWMKDGWRV